MALPFPGPTAVLGLTRSAVGLAVDSATTVVSLPARAFGLIDEIETVVRRITVLLDRVEAIVERTDRVVDSAEGAIRQVATLNEAAGAAVESATTIADAASAVITEAQRVSTATGVIVADVEEITARAGSALGRTESLAVTAGELLTAYESTLRKAAPMANRFVEQLSPEEVDAAIRLVDELPQLRRHLTSDVMPILATLDRVGPDIHDLLEVTRDLRLAIAGIPGLGMLRRRGENRLGDDDGS